MWGGLVLSQVQGALSQVQGAALLVVAGQLRRRQRRRQRRRRRHPATLLGPTLTLLPLLIALSACEAAVR